MSDLNESEISETSEVSEISKEEKEKKGEGEKEKMGEGEKENKAEEKGENWEEKAGEYLAGWKRAMADYENLKRDTSKEKAEFFVYAHSGLIIELLPIYDNFKAAFNTIPEEQTNNPWVVGFGHIKKQLADFLKDSGVEEIKTVGEKFDPTLHEALENIACEKKEDGIILKEIKSGYKLKDKVIQAAKVAVGTSSQEL
jgi:molecular chaperone GrpE